MLAVVIASALTPNVGVVQAQTNNQYVSPGNTNPLLSPFVLGGIVAVILAAILVALLLMRRRRRPPAAAQPPMQAWKGGGGPGGAAAVPPPSTPVTPPPAAAPAYLETPEDVGQAPPTVAVPRGAAAAPAAAEEAEPDIDSLMAELDKISGEILKRAPKKGQPPAQPPDEGP